MAKVKKGWEKNRFYGRIGGKQIKGVPLGELSESELQAILDGDPRNASRMIEGKPGATLKKDNKPDEPLPKAPKE